MPQLVGRMVGAGIDDGYFQRRTGVEPSNVVRVTDTAFAGPQRARPPRQ
jgi:hypothetical protein